MVVNTYTQRERRDERQPRSEPERVVAFFLCLPRQQVYGGFKKRERERETLYDNFGSDGSDLTNPQPHICRVRKSVSINTFALGDDGLQIGH